MGEIFVLAEHRKGSIPDITWEMLTGGAELATATGNELVAVLLGYNLRALGEKLATRAKKVLLVDDEKLANYNSEVYCETLSYIINDTKPVLTMIGHTSFGMDLAPRLAAHMNLPLSTACIDTHLKDGKLIAVRQLYNGKVNAEVSGSGAESYMVTIRPGPFPMEGRSSAAGEVKSVNISIKEPERTRFVEYVEAALGGIDITQADILVSVGQGIGDRKNIPLVEELADVLGGRLSCSRPVVDRKWLPKEHQVGSSGKTVKPKVYLAIGISGSFQHLMGIKGGTIIAINKDPRAPIFRVADYGIVGDLFQVVPILKEKAKALKSR
jgi:electron transfer flavoprotein alpha subunit